jgi:hypothetical protein
LLRSSQDTRHIIAGKADAQEPQKVSARLAGSEQMNSTYSKSAADAISKSSFQIQEGNYIYAKVSAVTNNDEHFLIAKDADEITVVTRKENLAALSLIERNKDDYRLIKLTVFVPFYSVGFLATVSDAFASKGMNILIVSTYSKDYLLVRAEHVKTAEDTLLMLGFQQA